MLDLITLSNLILYYEHLNIEVFAFPTMINGQDGMGPEFGSGNYSKSYEEFRCELKNLVSVLRMIFGGILFI